MPLHQRTEPLWNSCDGQASTCGWDDVVVDAQFRTAVPALRLIERTVALLAARGWVRDQHLKTPLGPAAAWTRTVAPGDTAQASLSPGEDGSNFVWNLSADAAPLGRRVSGC